MASARASLAVAIFLLLSGCDRDAADGYAFGRPEFTHLKPDIRFVEHPSIADLRRAAPAATRAQVEYSNGELMAWSALSGANLSICTVHIVDPAVAYAPEWIGHEITHCIHGRWHP